MTTKLLKFCSVSLGIVVAQLLNSALLFAAEDHGNGDIVISGELKQWHKIDLTLDGPFARELDTKPNPFLDYRMTVTFTHESGAPKYKVPGYFAADGNAAESSAEEGTKWRAHLSPDSVGTWNYEIAFEQGQRAAVNVAADVVAVAPFHGKNGSFKIAASDKTGRDFRGKGRLKYVGKHHLRFAGSGEYFLKAGPDAPETLLAYTDFDGTKTFKSPLKTWEPHLKDWKEGDPTWKEGKGKGLIGALNYLAGKGCNTFSFLSYNAGGDGDNVWPFVERDAPFHYDCSKLDQWQVVFDHAQANGLYLHFKMQETENDDLRKSKEPDAKVPTALDGGDLKGERKLYCRELIARFGYALALNWNIGEENTQSPEQQRAMIRYLHNRDPYHHNIVIHTYPNEQDKVYSKLLGDQSLLTGASLQNSWKVSHQRVLKWVGESAAAGRPWVVANDEQNPASMGVPQDPGYDGTDGLGTDAGGKKYDLNDIRKSTLWGAIMAGGAGVEYYFGYKLPQNDLLCQDFRSRDRSWDYCNVALSFFGHHKVPFWRMKNRNDLVGNSKNENTTYCLTDEGKIYLVYSHSGGNKELDLSAADGEFRVRWFNPRTGGDLVNGKIRKVSGGKQVDLGTPPEDTDDDWLVLVRRIVPQEK